MDNYCKIASIMKIIQISEIDKMISKIEEWIIVKILKKKIRNFLANQSNLPSYLYFVAFIYNTSFADDSSHFFTLPFFLLALLVLLSTNYNFFFTLSPLFKPYSFINPLFFLLGLFSCTDKWKLYLYCLSIGDSLLQDPIPRAYFVMIASIFLAGRIYSSLPIRNLTYNHHYFVGFGCMATLKAVYLLQSIFLKQHLVVTCIFLAAIGVILSVAFEKRIKEISQKNSKDIYSQNEMAHYLTLIQRTWKYSPNFKQKIIEHQRACSNLKCFCHHQEYRQRQQYFLRQLYEQAIGKFIIKAQPILYENYIQFLLKRQLVINALSFVERWSLHTYFGQIAFQRCVSKITNFLQNNNSSNYYQKQYTYALEYDKHSMYIATQINDVIKAKILFWKEINRESPKVKRIQQIGYQIQIKMYQLNLFYSNIIKPIEEKISVFNSTVFYAMYMLSTTSFKQYAQLIIKNTAKLLQQVYVFESRASETYAIRTVVRSELKCYIDQPRHILDFYKQGRPIACNDQKDNIYKLIIDTFSLDLCKILQIQKQDLIDHQLNTIIPDGYKEVHNVRLSYLLDFEVVNQIIPSKVLHKELKLPIKGANGKLLMGYVCIKFQVDIQKGLTFISTIKLVHDRSMHALIDFSGKVTQKEAKFNNQILKHREVNKYFNKIRNQWKNSKCITQQRFNLMVNSANYLIVISSPLLGLFIEKQHLKQQCPPIHIQIVNQQMGRSRNGQGQKVNRAGKKIKQMQIILQQHQAQSSTASSKSSFSAINIINSFSESNTVPLYRFVYISFIVVIFCCIVSIVGSFFATELPWDNSSMDRNPLNDTMNLYALNMLTIKSIITQSQVEIFYGQNNQFNKTRIGAYFGFQDYNNSIKNFSLNIYNSYKVSLKKIVDQSSQYLQDTLSSLLESTVLIANPNISSSATTYQSTTFRQFLSIFAADINLLANLKLQSAISSQIYSKQISQLQNCTFLSNKIDQGIKYSQKISIAVIISLIALIVALILPLFFLLRKRLNLHQKIFDLLVSIDSKEITLEIKSLQYINNIIRNYKQSSEVIKGNVLGYQQNVIHPKRQRRSSVNNQMILGLQKFDINQLINSSQRQVESHSTISQGVNIQEAEILKNKKKKGRRDSTVSLLNTQFISTKQETFDEGRKRAGQLDPQGSMLDPTKKIISSHFIVYSIPFSFLTFLLITLFRDLNYNQHYISTKDKLLKTYNQQIQLENYLLVIKGYLLSQTNYDSKQEELESILTSISVLPAYNYKEQTEWKSTILDDCASNTSLNQVFLKKYCQLSYSQVLLKGQFGSLFKQLSQAHYFNNKNVNNEDSTINMNLLQKFYYLQSLIIRIQELMMDRINILIEQILSDTKDYRYYKLYLMLISAIWGVCALIFGLILVLRLKRGYFRDVFMITFLNYEMVIKNKRVQSFLDSLAKNTYQ